MMVATTDPDHLALPGDWIAGLDGLPGYDVTRRILRITRDRTRLCDARGEPLAFLGRGHPLVRRAISRVRRSDVVQTADMRDSRVSIARSDRTEPAALLTFGVEIAGTRRIALQRVIAVLLPESGPAVEISQSERWLPMAAADRAIAADGIWQRPALRAGCRGAGHRPRSSPLPLCNASQPASPTPSASAPIATSPPCSAG